jgi:hypothetical protein
MPGTAAPAPAAASRRELAEMLADSKVYDGTAHSHGDLDREYLIKLHMGSTSQFLRKAVARRLGGQSMPLVLTD